MMTVSQADMYNSEPNPWPANATADYPNAPYAAAHDLLRLAPTTSAHPGASMSSGPGPTMVFHAPPVFSMQTTPIVAVGV
jgi:hypothetical protein